MFPVIRTEFLKLKRSLVVLLCIAAPTMVASLTGILATEWKKPNSWETFAMGSAGMWSFFMLPMTVTALTVLIAQLEHGPRTWNHLLALSIPRWRFYGSKIFVVLALVAMMSAGLALLIYLSGSVVDHLSAGTKLTGSFSLKSTATLLATMFAGSWLLVALQLWAALRFRSFVPPLVLGIGGTFVAVAATGAQQGKYFPWLLPTNALAADPKAVEFAIGLGFLGGLAAIALMLIDLSRKELV
jgi:ABC-2 type transport system permease protein